jgi:hypothetical protein
MSKELEQHILCLLKAGACNVHFSYVLHQTIIFHLN